MTPSKIERAEGGGRMSNLLPGDLDANARLIAAAPELLGALEGLVKTCTLRSLRGHDHVPSMRDQQDSLTMARAVIAKARGAS